MYIAGLETEAKVSKEEVPQYDTIRASPIESHLEEGTAAFSFHYLYMRSLKVIDSSPTGVSVVFCMELPGFYMELST